MNHILIRYCHSQISECCCIFKGCIKYSYIYVMILPCTLVMRYYFYPHTDKVEKSSHGISFESGFIPSAYRGRFLWLSILLVPAVSVSVAWWCSCTCLVSSSIGHSLAEGNWKSPLAGGQQSWCTWSMQLKVTPRKGSKATKM